MRLSSRPSDAWLAAAAGSLGEPRRICWAPAGTWVRAAAAGQVAAVRRRGAAGLELDLRHPDGLVTRYAHLGSVAPAIASGKQAVARGELLGRVGRSGIT